MTTRIGNCFADTAYWIGLVVKQDQYHDRARQWSLLVDGRITTTAAVLLETANALARPAWRPFAIALFQQVEAAGVEIVPITPELWQHGWELYRTRADKAWSLTDCMSFVAMTDRQLTDSLASDEHFKQAGYRTLLVEEPSSA